MSPRDAVMAGIALFLLGVVVPLGLTQIYAANTSGWNTSVKTIFMVLVPVLALIGIALYFLPSGK